MCTCIYKSPHANNYLFNKNLQTVLSSVIKINNSKICLLNVVGDFDFPHIKLQYDGMSEPQSYDDTSSSSKSLFYVTFRHKWSFKCHCNTIKT